MITIYRKTVAILICTLILLSGTVGNVFAATWESGISADGVLNVKGAETENGLPINLYITDADGKKVVIKQQTAGDGNSCSFSVDLEKVIEKSGEYTARLIAVNGESYTEEFTYCLSRDIEKLVDGDGEMLGINPAKDLGVTEVARVLKDNAELLAYLNPAAANMVKRQLFDDAAKILMNEDVTVSNVREVMTRTAVMAVFPHESEQTKAEYLKKYAAEIHTEKIKEYGTLDDKLFSKTVTRLNAVNEKYAKADDFYNGIYKMSVLAKLDFAYGNDSIQSILDAHTDLFDLTVMKSSDNNKSAMLKKIGKAFEDKKILNVSDVQAILNSKIKKDNASGGSGGSGSGGGGGGSKSGAITSLTPPTADERSQTNPYTEIAFGDMEGFEWAKESVNGLVELGVLKGYSNTEFRPYNSITRAEFCTVIAKLLGISEDMSGCEFADLNSSQWYYGYVNALYKRGIVRGTDTTTFGPDSLILRSDAAVILCRALGIAENTELAVSDNLFGDDESIADYAKNAVYALKSLGIVSGDEQNRFCPDNSILRAETAKLVWNAYRYTEGENNGE